MRLLVLTAAMLLADCRPAALAPARELHVAAAANLNRIFPELSALFEREAGIHIIPSYGATAQLAQQIENGAPFDVFLAADVEHVDELIGKGLAASASRAIYGRGQLAVWVPRRPALTVLSDLASPDVRAIAIARPELAPYGAAAVEALTNAGLWQRLKPRVVYAPSIAVAKQFADTGNADAAFTALALLAEAPGHYFAVDRKLHKPLDQALCIMTNSKEAGIARAFTAFLSHDAARAVLKKFGYLQP